jgi:hypothetical protein
MWRKPARLPGFAGFRRTSKGERVDATLALRSRVLGNRPCRNWNSPLPENVVIFFITENLFG